MDLLQSTQTGERNIHLEEEKAGMNNPILSDYSFNIPSNLHCSFQHLPLHLGTENLLLLHEI